MKRQWQFTAEEGPGAPGFDPTQADIELLGFGPQPEINWSGGFAASRVLLGSSLDPVYFVQSEEGENEIAPPVRLGACVGADNVDLCRIKWENLHLDKKLPYLEFSRGKAKKQVGDSILRLTPLLPSVVDALRAWRDYETPSTAID